MNQFCVTAAGGSAPELSKELRHVLDGVFQTISGALTRWAQKHDSTGMWSFDVSELAASTTCATYTVTSTRTASTENDLAILFRLLIYLSACAEGIRNVSETTTPNMLYVTTNNNEVFQAHITQYEVANEIALEHWPEIVAFNKIAEHFNITFLHGSDTLNVHTFGEWPPSTHITHTLAVEVLIDAPFYVTHTSPKPVEGHLDLYDTTLERNGLQVRFASPVALPAGHPVTVSGRIRHTITPNLTEVLSVVEPSQIKITETQ